MRPHIWNVLQFYRVVNDFIPCDFMVRKGASGVTSLMLDRFVRCSNTRSLEMKTGRAIEESGFVDASGHDGEGQDTSNLNCMRSCNSAMNAHHRVKAQL